MASKVVMPKMSDTMEEGLIIQWHKKEGDSVSPGDVLAEVETDKAIVELQAFAAGIVRKILVEEETKVPVGKLIAVIGKADENISTILQEAEQPIPAAKPNTAAPAEPKPAEVKPVAPSGKILASPLAKRIAEENGIDLSFISGTGPEGRITEKDVNQYLAEKVTVPTEYTEKELSLMRQTIAKRMMLSKSPIPHFYVTTEIEMDEVLKTKKALASINPDEKITITDILIKAVAVTLKTHPEINVSYLNGKIRYHQKINIGVAVALEEGLIVPVIRDADQKPLLQIVKEAQGLIQKAKKRTINPEEYRDGTFSITNLGMYDVTNFIAVISPPESAVLAVGTTTARPVVKNNTMVIRQMMNVTLSCDHRVIDGAMAAVFLKDLKQLLEQPTHVFS